MRLGYDSSLSIRVKELLDEGTLGKIMDQVLEDLKEELITSPPDAIASREGLYHEIHALTRVRLRMQTVVNDLMLAERGEI
jgi:hypothetical protein